jgi:hypothetical protein
MQIVKDLGTPEIIATSNRNVSNVQVITWQMNATEKKDPVKSSVSSVVEIMMRIRYFCV